VQTGDSLSRIAVQHGVTSASIVAANQLDNPDSLRIGQVLVIPDPS
jgi:LysM repeat protein